MDKTERARLRAISTGPGGSGTDWERLRELSQLANASRGYEPSWEAVITPLAVMELLDALDAAEAREARRLVLIRALTRGEDGFESEGECFFCGGWFGSRGYQGHASDCPWVEARAALVATTTETRDG